MGLRLWAWLLRKARCLDVNVMFFFLFLIVKWWGRLELIFKDLIFENGFLTSKWSHGLHFALANRSIGNYTTAITIFMSSLVRSSIHSITNF